MDDNLSKNIREDLLLFKNETLKDIKTTEKSLLEKYRNFDYTSNEKLGNFEKQLKRINDKVIDICAFIDTLKDVTNNITSLLNYRTKSENSLIDLDLKLKGLDKDFHNSIYSVNNILKNSVIYPRVIGSTAKFKTFHAFIDHILNQFVQSNQFKERITKEINENRIRQDNNMAKLKNNCDIVMEQTKSFLISELGKIEKKNNSVFKLYDEKFQNQRIDNEKYNLSIKNNESLINDFKDIIKDFDNKKNDMFSKYSDLNEKSKKNNNEIKNIKEKYQSLAEYIKQLSFKKEKANDDIKHLNIINKENDISLNFNDINNNNNKEIMNIKLKKNESGLKQYISSKINIDQLQKLQNKAIFNSPEPAKNNHFEKEEENINAFLGRTNNFKTVSTLKEEKKALTTKKENRNTIMKKILSSSNNSNNNSVRKNQNNEYSENNSLNNTYRNNKKADSFLKINTFSPLSNKDSDINLNSNQRSNPTNQFKNISLNLEGNEILKINTQDSKNPKYKNIIQNVKNILKKKNLINDPKGNNFLSGFPRIVTNQGERIIISSHPVYHRHKFTNSLNPNIYTLNKTIQKLYNKENKTMTTNIKDTLNKIHDNDKLLDYRDNKGINVNPINEKVNSVHNNFILSNSHKEEKDYEIIGKNKERNTSYQELNENRYYSLMTNENNIKRNNI